MYVVQLMQVMFKNSLFCQFEEFPDRKEMNINNMSCQKTFFLVNSLYTNNVLYARVHV